MPVEGDVNFDIDPFTGAEINGWAVVHKSLTRLITTNFGQRRMREHVGSIVPTVLGRSITQDTVLELLMGISMVIDLFEPRFRVSRFLPVEVTSTGTVNIKIEGEYIPRALLGDVSVRVPMLFEQSNLRI